MNNTLHPMTHKEQALGWPWFLIQLIFLPTALSFLFYFVQVPLSDAMLNVILFTLDFIVIVAIFHRYLLMQLRRAWKMIPMVLCVAVLGLMLYWQMNYWFAIVVTILQPNHVNANNQAIGIMAGDQFPLMLIGTVLLVPITEETLFRGLLFGSLYKKNSVLAYTVSVVVFSAVHVIGYIGQQDALSLLISFLQYLPAGIALGFVYARTGTLLTPILIHSFNNLLSMIVLRWFYA